MYTDGSATDAVQDGGAGSIIYLPDGDTIESATATGKHCTNYAAEVKALSQGAQAILDIVGNHKEDVVFLTDSKSVLDALAGHGEHELRVKLSKLIESRRVVLQWIPAHCGISGNEKADELAKRGANMQQENLPITIKQKKTIIRLQTTQPTSGGAVTADSSCCAICVEPPRPQQWGPDLQFFGHAGHADPLDGWRCSSQKRVMSRPIQVRQL